MQAVAIGAALPRSVWAVGGAAVWVVTWAVVSGLALMGAVAGRMTVLRAVWPMLWRV